MNSVIVSLKVDPQTKKQAMQTAEGLGMPLSVVIKAFLKQFIRTKTINFSAREEEPTPYFIKSLKKSEEDVKAGRVTSFKSVKEALEYLDAEIKRDKKNAR